MLGAARLTTKNLTPSYSVGLAPASTNEGAAGGFVYVTASVFSNAISSSEVVSWEIVPVSGDLNANDFDFNTGSITLNGSFNTFNIGIRGDSLTEGTESFFVRIRNASQQILATSNNVTISDTSTNATYAFTTPSSFTNPNEGTSTIFTIVTTNVANGTILPYAIRQTGQNQNYITAADFTSGSLTGTVTINNNTGSFTLTYVNDNLFEGSEAYYVDLYVAQSPLVNIQDTSDGGASLKINPDVFNYGEFLKLALPFRQSTQFNDISYTFWESTQNVAATRTGPIGVVISTTGQRFYDGAFIGDGTQTPPKYVTTTKVNPSGNFCVMFWAKTSSSNWNNWVFGNNVSNGVNDMGISISTYPTSPSPNGDIIRLLSYGFDAGLNVFLAGDGAAGRIGGLTANTWYHFCFTKTGWWVNGRFRGNAAWATGVWNDIVVGGQTYTSGGFSGGIQDFRVYVGNNVVSDYSNFTPPAQMIA